MPAPAVDTVAWFQIGASDPAAAKRFYGDLFGWTFAADPDSGPDYQLVSYRDAVAPSGGLTQASGQPYAAFGVLVADVEATCTRTVELGGKVEVPPVTTPDGLVFAHLLDGDGNQFLVFTPPSK
jgi:predicted enzyme related to lactoylglutathione lyase